MKLGGMAPATGPRSEWEGNIPLLIAAAFGVTMLPAHFVLLGTTLTTLQQSYGWSRFDILLSASISGAAMLLLGPVVGRLVDRVGARSVALAGVTIFPVALAALALSGPGIRSWVIVSVILAIVSPLVSAIVWTKPIAARFFRRRGLAMGTVLAGAGIASAVVPPLAAYLIQGFGWRSAFIAIGAILLGIGLHLTWFFFKETETACAAAAITAPTEPLSRSLRTPQFWQLVGAATLISGAVGALNIHGQSMMVDAGVTALRAAALVALLGPSQIVGRICGGWLLDRFNTPRVAALGFLTPTAACIVYLAGADGGWIFLAPLLVGLAQGFEVDVLAYLTSRYFHVRQLASISGFVMGAAYFALGAGPALMGWARDATGSYASSLWGLIAATIGGAALIATLRPYPKAAARNGRDSADGDATGPQAGAESPGPHPQTLKRSFG